MFHCLLNKMEITILNSCFRKLIHKRATKSLVQQYTDRTVQQKRVAINSMDGFEAWDSFRQGAMGEHPCRPRKEAETIIMEVKKKNIDVN